MTLDLVTTAQRGDPAAFGVLVDHWTRVALAVAFARTGRRELAAEVAQEAFLDAWRLLPTLREPAAFGAWLRRIVVKHADRATRRRRHETVPLDDALDGVDPDLDLRIDLDARWAAVRAALATLPVHQREVVALFYLSDRSHAEIARLLGESVPTVKKRLHDARKRLSPTLEATMTPMSDPAPVARTVRAFVAARTGRADLLAELLDADPGLIAVRRTPDSDELESRYAPAGSTLLGEAVAHGRRDVVALLLDRGAALDGGGGPSPLVHATELGREDIVELLLARGASPNVRSWHGGTALHVAARRAYRGLYDRLVAAGGDPDARDVFGRNAADWLAAAGPVRAAPRGRVVDAHGRALDGGPDLEVAVRTACPADLRVRETGIKAVDLLAPLPRAGVVHLVGGPWVGKLVLVGELGRALGPTVIAGLLDRTWDVRDFEAMLRELGIWDGAVVVLGTGPEDHGALARTALSLAEARGGWLVADDRLDGALRAAGPGVTVLTFGPHVLPDVLPDVPDRIVLDPARAARREFPAIDVQHSRTTSTVGPEHHRAADGVRAEVAADGPRAAQVLAWLTQPFRVAEDYLGRPGVRVPLVDTVRDTAALLAGSADPITVDELRYVGPLDSRGSWPMVAGAPF